MYTYTLERLLCLRTRGGKKVLRPTLTQEVFGILLPAGQLVESAKGVGFAKRAKQIRSTGWLGPSVCRLWHVFWCGALTPTLNCA